MLNHDSYTHRQFYESTIRRIHSALELPDDLCFVYVQHAFSPCIEHLTCVEERLAAIIPKGSSSKGNPQVVQRLQQLFPGRVLSHVTRTHLTDSAYAVQLLKDVTRGRPFAILEYGGYFAPAAARIAADRYLGPKLAGFVEGTENGIKGSDDGKTPGYLQVAAEVSRPILSKARSDIKHIMDLEIGPAIVESTDTLLRDALGCRLAHWRGNIGVIGLGSIGQGVLTALGKYNLTPMLHDTNTAVMAEMAYRQFNVAAQATVLANSDILFLNTGSCFLSQQPELLTLLKDHTILVLCTSGEIEAGIPQLINAGELQQQTGDNRLASYRTKSGKQIRVLLGGDQIGQAPNMVVEDGSGSPANLMSDMEFYAAGAYLASSRHSFQPGTIHESPAMLQQLIMEEWLKVFYPHVLGTISPSHARPSATSPTTNTADTPL
jgi:S-adenosylhomocysteine hydrolase